MSEQDNLVVKELKVGKRPEYAIYIGTNGDLEIWKLSNRKTGEYSFHKAVTSWEHLAERLISLSAGPHLLHSVEEMAQIYRGVAQELAAQLRAQFDG